jgi:hypothetical protein
LALLIGKSTFVRIRTNIIIIQSVSYKKIIQRKLSKPNLLGTNFCVRNRQDFGLYWLIKQIFSTLWLYLKFGWYIISVYSGFGLDRIYGIISTVLFFSSIFCNMYLYIELFSTIWRYQSDIQNLPIKHISASILLFVYISILVRHQIIKILWLRSR